VALANTVFFFSFCSFSGGFGEHGFFQQIGVGNFFA